MEEEFLTENPIGHVPPHDEQAEMNVVGALMLSADAFSDVVELLSPEDFYTPALRTIYDAELQVFGNGDPVDAVTVADYLNKNGNLDKIGGHEFLYTLTENVTVSNVEYYAKIVQDRSVLRNVIRAGDTIKQLGYTKDGRSAAEQVNIAQEEVFNLSSDSAKAELITVRKGISDTIKELKKRANGDDYGGIMTGIKKLDHELLFGLKPGQMVVVAARPAMGKSTLALDIARHAAFKQAKPTVIFNLEMAYTEILMRVLSAEKEIQHEKLVKGELEDDDFLKMADFLENGLTMKDGTEAPLFIDDTASISMMQIRTKCRRLAASDRGLGLIIIDYLQLMSDGGRPESRQLEVAAMSRKIKLLAKELKVPVIAISQLSRNNEQRGSKERTPQLSDLRDSGAIEQDADVVIFIHREERYHTKEEHDLDTENRFRRGQAQIIVAKNRSGRTEDFWVPARLDVSKFGQNEVDDYHSSAPVDIDSLKEPENRFHAPSAPVQEYQAPVSQSSPADLAPDPDGLEALMYGDGE